MVKKPSKWSCIPKSNLLVLGPCNLIRLTLEHDWVLLSFQNYNFSYNISRFLMTKIRLWLISSLHPTSHCLHTSQTVQASLVLCSYSTLGIQILRRGVPSKLNNSTGLSAIKVQGEAFQIIKWNFRKQIIIMRRVPNKHLTGGILTQK